MIAQLSNPWWVFVVLGVVAGIVSGTLGLGSGTVVVPALVLICYFGQKSAQGIALAVMVPMAFVGALRYWRNGIEMDWLVIALIICGALVGTLAGTELVTRLPAYALRKACAIFLVVVAVKMFLMSSKASPSGIEDKPRDQNIANSIQDGDITDITNKR